MPLQVLRTAIRSRPQGKKLRKHNYTQNYREAPGVKSLTNRQQFVIKNPTSPIIKKRYDAQTRM